VVRLHMLSAASASLRYLGRVWDCRYFWLSLVRMDLRNRYRRSTLGMGWSLLNPLLMTGVLCAVFGTLFDRPASWYAPYVLLGLAFWSFLVGCVQFGCHALHYGEPYIRHSPAPMAIYPLRATLAAAVHLLVALSAAVALTTVMRGAGTLTSLPMLLPGLLVVFVIGWATATLLAFAWAYFPDAGHLCEVGLQFAFYLTPIIYPPDVVKPPALQAVMAYNPLAAAASLIRTPILDGRAADPTAFVVAGSWAFVLAAAASLTVSRLERRVIFQL
jgi:lipopolysaccharide transport system permease protein